MDESIDWRALLYPGEWAFRFFVAALIVWLVGREWINPIIDVGYCVLTVAVAGTAALQVWVLLRYARRGSEPAAA